MDGTKYWGLPKITKHSSGGESLESIRPPDFKARNLFLCIVFGFLDPVFHLTFNRYF